MLAIPVWGIDYLQQLEQAAQYADAIELRYDLYYDYDPVAIDVARKKYGFKVIATVGDDHQYIRVALDVNPDYLSVEYCEGLVLSPKDVYPARLIISYHDHHGTPKDLEGIYKILKAAGAEIVKVATMAHSALDALRVLLFVKKHQGEVVGIAMGNDGLPSRVLGPIVGNHLDFAALSAKFRTAPGQLSAEELLEKYHYRHLNSETDVLGVIGDPISQSSGPMIHNRCYRREGLNAVYLPWRVSKEDLPDFLVLAQQLEVKGLSVTMPLKQAILPGCFNTLLFKADVIKAYNTDGEGAWQAIPLNPRGLRVVILGRGGAAQAIADEGRRRGAQVTMVYRSSEHLRHALEEEYDILINATPVGMTPDVDQSLVPKELLKVGKVVMDIVSNPRETRLLREARQRGCRVVEGWEMFLNQAKLQHRIWFPEAEPRIDVPPSKSQTMRALLFASLAQGQSTITNILPSPDTEAMVAACRQFGAIIDLSGTTAIVEGLGGAPRLPREVIESGNSGLVLRLTTALAALCDGEVIITGDQSIKTLRPMMPMIEGLQHLGVDIESLNGNEYAPVRVRGPIYGGEVILDGRDSQPVSAILLAAALAPEEVVVNVNNPGERPWVEMTLQWLDKMGVDYCREGFEKFKLAGRSLWQGFEYHVPGDFSSAAYPIMASLVSGKPISVDNLDFHDPQGDKAVIAVLKTMGAQLRQEGNSLHVEGGKLVGRDIDINDFIDALPILAVAGCYSQGVTRLYNGANARRKESNRIDVMAAELGKLGGKVTPTADGLIIENSQLRGGVVKAHADHRVAMALEVAAIGAEGKVIVEGREVYRKSYPSFFGDLKRIKG
ncbi:MAG: 3-phosphoshikimate 1-carboxyvinyltransferase [Chlamydiota bacterium]